jgi:hypothetical protein
VGRRVCLVGLAVTVSRSLPAAFKAPWAASASGEAESFCVAEVEARVLWPPALARQTPAARSVACASPSPSSSSSSKETLSRMEAQYLSDFEMDFWIGLRTRPGRTIRERVRSGLRLRPTT